MQGGGDFHDFSLFGLKVRSALEIPELPPAHWTGEPDVTIHLEPASESISEHGLAADGDTMTISISDVARFRVSCGGQIAIVPDRATDPRNIRLFLLGSAFGALLHQRALLPLHANAVAIGGKAFAFMGQSGAGKSTLAAWFHDRGYPILADDVCVVGFDGEGLPRAYPGLPRLRLWLDALESTGRSADGLSRSYAGPASDIDKFDLPVASESMVESDLPLAGLYVLDRGEQFAIEPLGGMAAADAIIANTYRGAYVAAAKTQQQHWQSAVKLARMTPVFLVRRPWNLARLDQDCAAILHHAGKSTAD
jgi:hypothetical protein